MRQGMTLKEAKVQVQKRATTNAGEDQEKVQTLKSSASREFHEQSIIILYLW